MALSDNETQILLGFLEVIKLFTLISINSLFVPLRIIAFKKLVFLVISFLKFFSYIKKIINFTISRFNLATNKYVIVLISC